MSPPLVTIISPCFNLERFVGPMVRSVARQTEPRWELIVVDDGSSDRSVVEATAAAAGDARVHVLPMTHRGVAHTRNAGVTQASPTSRYLLFLDADDELEPTMLERCVRELDSNSRTSMVHTRVTFIDESGQILPGTPGMSPRYVPHRLGVRVLEDSERETPFASIVALAGIIPSCSMIRRSAFVAVGGWDETFGQGFEDTDLFLRLALHAPIHQIATRLVRHRRHPGQSSDQPGRHDAQIIKLHARWRDLDRIPPELTAVVLKAWHFHDRQLNWYRARLAARRLLSQGHPLLAARFLGGALHITLRSWVRASSTKGTH